MEKKIELKPAWTKGVNNAYEAYVFLEKNGKEHCVCCAGKPDAAKKVVAAGVLERLDELVQRFLKEGWSVQPDYRK